MGCFQSMAHCSGDCPVRHGSVLGGEVAAVSAVARFRSFESCGTQVIASAAADLGDKFACKERVLDALTEIMKFETDPVFAKLAQRRFLDLMNKEEAA
jgi:hypothetical protein